MKKILFLLLALMLVVSCQPEVKKETGHKHDYSSGICTCGDYKEYEIGAEGPAGGYIFYDVDADNTEEDPDGLDNLSSEVCGWRYLEAAPADITVPETDNCFCFGYFAAFDDTYCRDSGTSEAIGTGKENSDALMATIKTPNVYKFSDSGRAHLATNVAVELCDGYSLNSYDDWFLPSIDELRKMMFNLWDKGIGTWNEDDSYWSSSEDRTTPRTYAVAQFFKEAYKNTDSQGSKSGRRAVRAARRF